MKEAKEEKEDIIRARTVLWYLVFVGFGVNYMIRINLNIAVVSMVKQRPKTTTAKSSECIQESTSVDLIDGTVVYNVTDIRWNYTNQNYTKPNYTTEAFTQPTNYITGRGAEDESTTFDWDEYILGLLLGAFYWLHWLTQIPGGMLAQKYGAKLVFGLSNFLGVLICFIIPMFSYMGYQYLIILRVIQGLICGFAWPAMHNMTAKWIPPNERSKFVTAYLGSSVGTALTYPLCGWIIDRWGWELVFYINGVLGTTWYIMWYFFVFDSPAQHPRISQSEKVYILSSLGHSVSNEKEPVPWKQILTSLPVWMNILAQWGGIWGVFTLMTHAPMYFKYIHGWDMKATGVLSGMPHLLRVMFAFAFSALGDYLLRSNKMSRTNVRKLGVSQCCVMQGLLMLGLAYSGCSNTAAIFFLSATTAVTGAVSTGPLASLVDISPNYASICLGMCNTIVAVVGFLTPAVVSFLTFENQTVAQWQKVYWIAAIMLLTSGILYILFSKSELQPWNSPEIYNKVNAETELKALQQTEIPKDEVNVEDGVTDAKAEQHAFLDKERQS